MVLESAQDFRRAGVARYAFELIDAFVRNPRGHEFHLFLMPTFDPPASWRSCPSVRIHLCWERYNRWNLVAAGAVARNLKLDFYLSTAHTIPLFTRVPRGLMIHDLFPLSHPEWFPEGHARFYRRVLPASCRRSAVVFANSRATAADVERLLSVDPAKIVVTPLGPGEELRCSEGVADRSRLGSIGVPFDRYLLFVGTIEPRKNLSTLLRAFAKLSEPGLGLVIAGGRGWKYEADLDLIDQLCLADRVALLGYVPDHDLGELYAGAELFVYPSLLEGFGLPILEAMQAGVPVACSGTGAMPEVGGEAVRYFDPKDADQMAEVIASALDGTGDRDLWIDRGRRRAAKFDWSITADLTLDAIEAHLAGGTGH